MIETRRTVISLGSMAELLSIINNKDTFWAQPVVHQRLTEVLNSVETEGRNLVEANQIHKDNYGKLLQQHQNAVQKITALEAELGSMRKKLFEKTEEFKSTVQKNKLLEQRQKALLDKEVIGKTPHLMIETSSLFDLNGDGWKITLTNFDKIRDLSLYGLVTASALGDFDSGKSFLLNELGADFDSGFSKRTSAISISFPEEAGDYFALIDTPGSKEAVQTYDKETLEKLERNLSEDTIGSVLKGPFPELGPSDEERMETSVEELEEEKKKRHQLIYRYLHNDRRIIDSLKEKFIIEHVDMIFIVVGKLSESESEMIQRSVNYYEEVMNSRSAVVNKNLRNKRLYIIHNFKMLQTVEDVERQIQRDIFSCFDVKKTPMFNRDFANKGQLSRNKDMYIDSQGINHVVLAAKGTAAGEYYNVPAIEFLKQKILVADFKSRIDFSSAFLEFCKKKLPTMIQQEVNLKFDAERSAIVEESKKGIKIGRMRFSELGDVQPADSYVPCYSTCYYESEKESTVVLDIELLDCQFEAKWSRTGGRDYIMLKGEKRIGENLGVTYEKVNHSRQSGAVFLSIPLLEDREKPKIKKENLNNGIWRFTVVYQKPEQEAI